MATTTKSNKKKPDYLTLRRQLGSNVFKKQPKAVSYYGQTMSSYYNNAYQYVNESIKEYTKTSTYTTSTGGGGSGGGGSSAPNPQENTRRVEDELRKQMVKSEETINKYMNLGYVPFIGEDGQVYQFSILPSEGQKENPLMDYMYRTPGFQEAFKVALDPTSNFSDRREALEQMQNMVALEMPNLPPEAGKYVAYAYSEVNPYGKDVMEYYSPTSYYMPSAKNYDIGQWLFSIADNPFNDLTPYDRTQVRNAANAVSTGNFIQYSNYENTLKPIIEKANSPENIIRTEEGKYYLEKKDEIYNLINDPNSGLSPAQRRDYQEIWNNLENKKPLSDKQFDLMYERFPEVRDNISTFDGSVQDMITIITNASSTLGGTTPKTEGNSSTPDDKDIIPSEAQNLADPKNTGLSALGGILYFLGSEQTSLNKAITGEESKGISTFSPSSLPIFSNVSLQIGGMGGMGGVTVGGFEINPASWILDCFTKTVFGTDVYGRPSEPTGTDYVGTALLALQIGSGVAAANGVSFLATLRNAPVVGKYVTMIDDALSHATSKVADKADELLSYHNRKPPGFTMQENKIASYLPEDQIINMPKNTPTTPPSSGIRPDPLNFPSTSPPTSPLNVPPGSPGTGNINIYGNVQEVKNFPGVTGRGGQVLSGVKQTVDDQVKFVQTNVTTLQETMDETSILKVLNSIDDKLGTLPKQIARESGWVSKIPYFKDHPTQLKIVSTYMGLTSLIAFNGFYVTDTLMQFDDISIGDAMEKGDFSGAVGRLNAYSEKHTGVQFAAALLTELAVLPFATMDAILGTSFSHYMPMFGATITAYGDYEGKGTARAADLVRYGLWVGDFNTGRPATRAEIEVWYNANKNDRSLFPNSAGSKQDVHNTVKHSYYQAVINDEEYDTKVRNITVATKNTPLKQVLSNIFPKKDDVKPTGQGVGTGFGVLQPSTGIIPISGDKNKFINTTKASETQTIASDILKNATDISQVKRVARDLGVNLEGRMQFTSDKSLEGYKNALLTEIRDNENSPFTIDRRDKTIYTPPITNQNRSNYFKKVETPETIKWDSKYVPQAATYGGQGAFNYNQPSPDPSWSANISDDRPWLNTGQSVFDWSNIAAQNPMTQQRYDQMINEEQQRIYDQMFTPSLNFTFAELMEVIEYDPVEAMKKDKKT